MIIAKGKNIKTDMLMLLIAMREIAEYCDRVCPKTSLIFFCGLGCFLQLVHKGVY